MCSCVAGRPHQSVQWQSRPTGDRGQGVEPGCESLITVCWTTGEQLQTQNVVVVVHLLHTFPNLDPSFQGCFISLFFCITYSNSKFNLSQLSDPPLLSPLVGGVTSQTGSESMKNLSSATQRRHAIRQQKPANISLNSVFSSYISITLEFLLVQMILFSRMLIMLVNVNQEQ